MKNLNFFFALTFIFTLSSCSDDCFLGLIGPGCDPGDEEEFSIIVEDTEKISEQNKIKIRFKVIDDNGIGVPNKIDSDFNLYEKVTDENEQLIDPSEAPRLIVPSPESYGYATMIIMDLSGSVIDDIDTIKAASIDYVNNLFGSINSGNLEVGVFFFDGRIQLQTVIDFSNSKNEIITAISGMDRELQTEKQTALYHAVIQSCGKINSKKQQYENNSEIKIFSSSMVVFSDGNNSNFENVSKSQMVSAIASSTNNTYFYCIASGGNVDNDVVNEIGKDAVFKISNYESLNQGLSEVLDIITREANSNYELEICTAKRGTNVDYRLELKGSITNGGTGVYSTTGFSPQNECNIGN